MRFGGHSSGAGLGHFGHFAAVPGLMRIIGISVLIVAAVPLGALLKSGMEDWAARRFGASSSGVAGSLAVAFVALLAGWLVLKIFRS
jgi:hypothetical protein